MTGLHEIEAIADARKLFGISELLIEGVLNAGGRPKMEPVKEAVLAKLRFLRS